jgi:hypothetical protein
MGPRARRGGWTVRPVSAFSVTSEIQKGSSMRYFGMDLHTTTFVVCFLSEQGKGRVDPFTLTVEGVTAFRRQLRADDAIAVEAGQTT